MIISDKKIKDGTPVNIDSEQYYIACETPKEKEYAGIAAFMIDQGVDKLVVDLKDGTTLLFVKKKKDGKVSFEEKVYDSSKDEEDAAKRTYDIEDFFTGYTSEVIAIDDIPNYFGDKKKKIIMASLAVCVFILGVVGIYKFFFPAKTVKTAVVAAQKLVPQTLINTEIKKLTNIASRQCIVELVGIMDQTDKERHSAINLLSIQKSVGSDKVGYIITGQKIYSYPVVGSSASGEFWIKPFSKAVEKRREDIREAHFDDYSGCARTLLSRGYLVKTRDEKCATFFISDDNPNSVIKDIVKIQGCNFFIVNLSLSSTSNSELELCI